MLRLENASTVANSRTEINIMKDDGRIGLNYHHQYKRTEENQLDATECFIALIICSTCFGHLHAHHQELETILVLLPHMVCNALVAGGRLLGAEQQAMRTG